MTTDTIDYLAIIPARGGSKRLPGKNIKPLGDKPLIAWSIESALNAKHIDQTIVSTDSEEIAAIGKKYGAEIPFIRPADIAGDQSSVVDALRHAVSFFENSGINIKNIVLLQATNPFRTGEQIDSAIKAFEEKQADSLTSVSPAKNHPYYALKGGTQDLEPFFDVEKLSMRAFELPPACYENGAVFIMSRDTIMNHGIYGPKSMIIAFDDPALVIDIDTEHDFSLAEFLLKKRGA